MNLCTSTLPGFSFEESLDLASAAGYQGIELRVHDDYHVTLDDLFIRHREIRRMVESRKLELSVFNTYYGLTDVPAVDTMIDICQQSGVKYFRVALPLAGHADVRNRSAHQAILPSYQHHEPPSDMLHSVRRDLRGLESRATAAGVCALVEIHWGTVMSSFSSAHALLNDIDPQAVAITFDPANMIIEGREDWDYGIQLLRDRIANVHIKNVSWERGEQGWKWRWDGLWHGMVDWPKLFGLLVNEGGYRGMFAMEDFRVPEDADQARLHLLDQREETRFLLWHAKAEQLI